MIDKNILVPARSLSLFEVAQALDKFLPVGQLGLLVEGCHPLDPLHEDGLVLLAVGSFAAVLVFRRVVERIAVVVEAFPVFIRGRRLLHGSLLLGLLLHFGHLGTSRGLLLKYFEISNLQIPN